MNTLPPEVARVLWLLVFVVVLIVAIGLAWRAWHRPGRKDWRNTDWWQW